MGSMETAAVASGLAVELKVAVAACVVLATLLLMTMVSEQFLPGEGAAIDARCRIRCAARTHAIDAHHALN